MALDVVNYTVHDPSYFNNTVHGKMRRVALDGSGNVVGIHHPDNTNLWEDGSTVNWTTYESNGWNCMVEIPKYYYKVEFGTLGSYNDVFRCYVSETQEAGYKLHPAFERDTGVIRDYQYFSAFEGSYDASNKLRSLPNKTVKVSQTRAQFRTAASLNGTNYRQQEFYLTSAIQMLFITEFADMNSQRALGLGKTDGNHLTTTGASLTQGNKSYGDKILNTQYMSYRGIENFWGNYYKMLDGLNMSANIPYISKKNFADSTITGDYVRVGTGIVPASGYIKNFHKNATFDFSFIPSVSGGLASTYLGDYVYSVTTAGNYIALFGGRSSFGLYCGAFFLRLDFVVSDAASAVGARLSCI